MAVQHAVSRSIHRLGRIARQALVAGCLVPASRLHYRTWRRWFEALRDHKAFFHDILANAPTLLETTRDSGRLLRLTVGLPLRLACEILKQNSVRTACAHLIQQSGLAHAFPQRLAGNLPRPRLVPLLDGLLEPGSGRRHAQAVATAWQHIGTLRSPQAIDPAAVRRHVVGCRDFTGTTTAVVAHWDPQGVVDAYVVYLCRQFKKLGWKVVLASGGPVRCEERPDWADAVISRICDGYDFTSWKAALATFPTLLACKELVLCNDSVFGGLGAYGAMHAKMAALPCDFWGITESHEVVPHLQSFYLVFRPAALRHPAFSDFFDRVPLCNARTEAIRCETTLSLWLALHGLRPAAFVPCVTAAWQRVNPSCERWAELLRLGAPVFKRELVLKNEREVSLVGWMDRVIATGYPLALLVAYCNRIGVDITPAIHANAGKRAWPPCVQARYRPLPAASPSPKAASPQEPSPPIGVFLHLYYLDVLEEMLSIVRNLPDQAHIFISTESTAKKERIAAECTKRGLASRTEIRVLPNQGWDIAPFLVGFAEVIPRYPLLLRLHSKRSTYLTDADGDAWRGLLYEALAGSKQQVERILGLFQADERLGLLCPPILPQYADRLGCGGNFARMRSLLAVQGLRLRPDTPIDFPMGAMFWCRSRVLQPWLEQRFSFDDFGPTKETQRDGNLAHALERLFLFGCALQGYTWSRILPAPVDQDGLFSRAWPTASEAMCSHG